MTELPHLVWTPKPFGPGDIDGEGVGKLLGQPNLDRANLLVRETAQNSWDARTPGITPLFEMNLRRLDPGTTSILRHHVLPGDATGLDLDVTLAKSSVRVLEVADRGTKGLAGPIRNDIATPAHTPTNFIDFVLSIGAPKEGEGDGGTYGFGKTASYGASRCGTVLIWTRVLTPEGLEERLIGSAIGPSFTHSGKRYTGRHWWSAPCESTMFADRTAPLVGGLAGRLARSVFHRHFEGDETGTSLLIIDPIGEHDDAPLVEAWRVAIVRNLWPKLIEGQEHQRSMDIRLLMHGSPVPLLGGGTRAVRDAKARCLAAIRRAQLGDAPDDPLIELREIWCGRPKQLLGHLALTRMHPVPPAQAELVSTVTYMRSRAELIVKAEAFGKSSDNLMDWVGVFKPVSALDETFSRAEPPAHDNWSFEGFPARSHERTFVKIAMQRIRETINTFINPTPAVVGGGSQVSTAQIAAELGGLTGSATEGHAPRHASRPSGRPRRNANRGGRLVYSEVIHLAQSESESKAGLQTVRVGMRVEGDSPVRVAPSRLALAVEQGSEESESGEVAVTRWTVGGSDLKAGAGIPAVAGGETLYVDIQFPAGLAIDFDFVAQEVR